MKRGIAISSMIYMVLITFIFFVLTITLMLVSRLNALSAIKSDIKEQVTKVEEMSLVSKLEESYSSTNTVGLLKDLETYYYKGDNTEVSNNYLMYEGKMWRVLEFDTDSITLVLEDGIGMALTGETVWDTTSEYQSSVVNTYLNSDFKEQLSDQSLIVDTIYNVGNYSNISSQTSVAKVGILDYSQYLNSFNGTTSYLVSNHAFFLANSYNSTNMYYVNTSGILMYQELNSTYTVKPVITISDPGGFTGIGTIDAPYIIDAVIDPCLALVDQQYEFAYTGSVQTLITECPGNYFLQVWGAEGGYRTSAAYAGNGGYSDGVVNLKANTSLFIYSGGSGNTGGTAGGFNGGGAKATYNGGGGASDIRIGVDSLYSRVIVAGGGGSDGAANKTGGYGGGVTGQTITQSYGSGGGGASQTAGGTGSSSNTSTNGTFGVGGSGIFRSSGYGGAGGGGFYGGAGSYPDGSGDDDRGGGGGSGYVYTESTASSYPTGVLINPSFYLTNTELLNGANSFMNYDGTIVTGKEGDGYARITYLGK